MIKKLRVKYLTREIRRLRKKGKQAWKDSGKKTPWYGPQPYLSPKEAKRYRTLSEKRFKLVTNFGADVTGTDFDRYGPDATKALDEVNAEYKEVVPTYFDEDGKPKGSGPFVSD